MAVTDQHEILDRKIKLNEARYDLDRIAAKISALSSGNLDKYECLTGEDLNYKPSTVDQAKFDYSPLSKFFAIRLKEENEKEGFLKRLKHIEGKSEEHLKAIKRKNENIKEVTDFVEKPLSLEPRAVTEEIKIIQRDIDYRKSKIIVGNSIPYDFSEYKIFKDLFRDMYYRTMKINKAEQKQDELRQCSIL